jgi:hypothetical protein
MDEDQPAAEEPALATARRNRLPPDIALGSLSLWIGRSPYSWLDVAVRVASYANLIAEQAGPLIQRRDLAAWDATLAWWEGEEKGEARLASEGASLGIRLTRYADFEANYCEVRLSRSIFEQRISFAISRQHLVEARAGIQAVMERLKRDDEGQWRPFPASVLSPPGPAPAAPPREPQPPVWDSGLGEGVDVSFDYVVDGVGWFSVAVTAGGEESGFGGSSFMTDAMGDLIRAGLSLLGGARRVEVTCDAEPFLTRVEFERVLLRSDASAEGRPAVDAYGCRIRIIDIDPPGGPAEELRLDVLCRSPRHVAEALYRMAVPHFEQGVRNGWLSLAALEGALRAVASAEGEARG